MSNNRKQYNFDWNYFTEKEFDICNSEIGSYEDNIYGFLYITENNKAYLVDIHYEYYDSDNKGFDLEVYMSNENWMHNFWLGSIKEIKSAQDYKMFCYRAEDMIVEFLSRRIR